MFAARRFPYYSPVVWTLVLVQLVSCFVHQPKGRRTVGSSIGTRTLVGAAAAVRRRVDGIEYQSDGSKYGRGERHLSAILDRGDVVVFQTGTWFVDGVAVGDGGPTQYQYGAVETLQLVWTHNCEHGVLRARSLKLLPEGNRLAAIEQEDEWVEFGPEQLVAKLPLVWNEHSQYVESSIPLNDDLWRPPDSSE